MSELAELVSFMARMLVDHPESVVVTEAQGENTTVIRLRVGPGDFGKVIGKEGRIARSLRTILMGASTKLGRRTVLEIEE